MEGLSQNPLLELDFCMEGMWPGKALPSKSLSKEESSPTLILILSHIQILAEERKHPKPRFLNPPEWVQQICLKGQDSCSGGSALPFLSATLLLLLPVCKGSDASACR